ncbi:MULTISPECIES: hypothetical protein [Gordonia]|uniref:hypothetical protein n=1 Tax=Gordonia TaxID=2053 RepID=UPI0008160A83|nr:MULTISPECIES: hypothetical protein [unclassified Gordonia (in: high G+C Gram-positive bacteria)]MBN0975331.1 hypothetical protein [Gordonia sp. BP-119]MBN0985477.1 hypothetical protein [Gordonia sp. BP-94]SCB95715.1 hypothetical protein GA0061091_103234 [Gordonia sp. v-85]
MTMTLADAAKRAIESFFSAYESVVINMKLPDGNFGKPFDNYYKLESVDTDNNQVNVGLGYGLVLHLTPTGIAFGHGFFDLKVVASNILLESEDLRLRYDSGIVTFEVYPDDSSSIGARDAALSTLEDAASNFQ